MNQTLSAAPIVGVDTHKPTHAAVTGLGARLGSTTVPASAKGYRDLETWAKSLGAVQAFGIEGTGSYGAGLPRFLCEQGHTVLEVGRPNRQFRHQKDKADHLGAESAARAVLGGQATALPKSGTSTAGMIRHLKVARDTAVKSRTQAMLALKATIVSVPAALREQLEAPTGKMALLRHLAALRPGTLVSTTTSAKTSLRALARRWLALNEEVKAHDAHLEQLAQQCAPTLVEAHGTKANTAAETLLLVGGNPGRIHSEAALAKSCGVCPVTASSGKTSRHRLNRGGHRQANAALYHAVVVHMHTHQPTIDYARRRTAEGKSKPEVIRCLKRFVVREVFSHLCRMPKAVGPTQIAA